MPWRAYFPEYIKSDFDAMLAAALQVLISEIDPLSGNFMPFVVLVDLEGELLTAAVRATDSTAENQTADVLSLLLTGVRERRDEFRSGGIASPVVDEMGEHTMLRLDVEMPLGDESLGQVIFVPYDVVLGEPRFGDVDVLDEDAQPVAAIWR